MDSEDNSADPIYLVACEVQNQANKLDTCMEMLREAANFNCNDAEQAKKAQARILYLVDSLETISRDLGNLAEAAHNGATSR